MLHDARQNRPKAAQGSARTAKQAQGSAQTAPKTKNPKPSGTPGASAGQAEPDLSGMGLDLVRKQDTGPDGPVGL